MQHLKVSGAVRYIYIYIYVIRRLKVNSALGSVVKPKETKDFTGVRSGAILLIPDCIHCNATAQLERGNVPTLECTSLFISVGAVEQQ